MTIWDRKKLSFGFVSTRFAGTDGVSLETDKLGLRYLSYEALEEKLDQHLVNYFGS